ncbi:hypothetical protein H2203_003519 [Taxawa tesnikishii (nom. ined.)]|nr:hypothetical protein H2203_003519 [Dothideales sp. JES 119]
MPGVPPDALDTVKKALKGMFRRNKKPKSTTQSSTTTPTPAAQQKPAPTPAQPAPPTEKPISAVPAAAPVSDNEPSPVSPADTEPLSAPARAKRRGGDSGHSFLGAIIRGSVAATTAVVEPPDSPAKAELAAADVRHQTASTTSSSSPTAAQARPNGQHKYTHAISGSDEKIPVMSEPPVVKPINAAPGMSATSGPLEDYPEYGR